MQPGLDRLIIESTTLAEALASHGYIVAGVMPRRRDTVTITDVPAALTAWAKDAAYAVTRLTSEPSAAGLIDVDAIGIFGHSFGGAAAVEVCRADARFKAGVDLDGYPASPEGLPALRQPFLFIWSEAVDPSDRRREAEQNAERIAGPGRQTVILGMRHFNFTDHAALAEPPPGIALGAIDGRHGLRIAGDLVRAFFDQHLRPVPVFKLSP